MELVDDRDFFTWLKDVRKMLEAKLEKEAINAGMAAVAKICVSNIEALLKKSKLHQKQEQEPLALDPTEIAVKAAITRTVVEQYKRAGRSVGENELAHIVEREYARVKEKVPAEAIRNVGEEERTPMERTSKERTSKERASKERTAKDARAAERAASPWESDEPGHYGRTSKERDSGARRDEMSKEYDGRGYFSSESGPSSHSYASKPPESSHASSSTAAKDLVVDWNALQSAVQTASKVNTGESSSQQAGAQSESKDEYEELSIQDLVNLFNNFNELDKDNQGHLIQYMKKLEKSNPDKVNELKTYIHGIKR